MGLDSEPHRGLFVQGNECICITNCYFLVTIDNTIILGDFDDVSTIVQGKVNVGIQYYILDPIYLPGIEKLIDWWNRHEETRCWQNNVKIHGEEQMQKVEQWLSIFVNSYRQK